MRFKLSAVLLALAAAVSLVASPLPHASSRQQRQQQDEQDITESFVTSRGAGFGERPKRPAGTTASTSASAQPKKKTNLGTTSNKSAKSTKRTDAGDDRADAPAKGPANTAGKNDAATKTATGPKTDPATKTTPAPAGPNTNTAAHHAAAPADETRTEEASATSGGAVGLGYTILKVSGDGSNTVVDPARPFAAGDKIRVALETNADGYLYIFNAENDQPDPLMLYPHAAVDSGSNRIAAHVRDFFPADLRYTFEFDDAAATEHLYIIFSRRPLAEVPAGAALLEYCGAKSRDECYWKPTPEQWARIKTGAAAGRVVESRNKDLAAAQGPLPPATLSRGIKVKKDEPAPAVVRMNASADAEVLLTKIELVHR